MGFSRLIDLPNQFTAKIKYVLVVGRIGYLHSRSSLIYFIHGIRGNPDLPMRLIPPPPTSTIKVCNAIEKDWLPSSIKLHPIRQSCFMTLLRVSPPLT